MLKMAIICVGVAAFVLPVEAPVESDASGEMRIPSCGFCAAYSFLLCSQSDVHLDDLTAAFDGVDVSESLTVLDLRQGLSKVGFETQAVRFQPSQIEKVPTPSILFISPGKWPRRADDQVGHFVTLVKFVDDRAVLLDWAATSIEPAIHISAQNLATYWDGVALVPAEKLRPVPFAAALILLIGLGYLGFRSKLQRITGVVLFLCVVNIGCAEVKSAADAKEQFATLVFDQHLGDLGEVTQKSISSHEFRFRVWDKGAVTIRDVQVSCGCTVPDNSLTGVKLEPGSEHVFKVSIRPDGGPSVQTKSLRVLTSPASDVPIVLAVSYKPFQLPQLSVNKLVSKASLNRTSTADLVVSKQRHPSAAQLEIIRSESEFADFSLVEHKYSEATSIFNESTGEKITKDILELRFRGKAYTEYGVHRGLMVLRFSDGNELSLPTEITVKHPITPSLDRVFVGVVKSRAMNEHVVRIDSGLNDDLTVSHDGELISSAHLEQNVLTIQTIAPTDIGRHEAVVRIESQSLPSLSIPVVCIVK